MNKLLCAIALIAIANVGTWFQFQGHYWSDKLFFKSPWFICGMGTILSMSFWHATRLSYEHFGQFWNIRLIGFGIGTITFGILTWLLTHEVPTIKTFICLLLAIAIILIQITNVADV
tara:strand:+ start:385 stop:735 length:351 start_codon:yes stop_codon:yes gene_type:complete